MTDQTEPTNKSVSGIGCAWTILAINTVLIGLVASSFVRGPYSSDGQEFWYRYVSLGLFAAGAVLPAISLFAGRRSNPIVRATVVWMCIVFLAFVAYTLNSGGGV